MSSPADSTRFPQVSPEDEVDGVWLELEVLGPDGTESRVKCPPIE